MIILPNHEVLVVSLVEPDKRILEGKVLSGDGEEQLRIFLEWSNWGAGYGHQVNDWSAERKRGTHADGLVQKIKFPVTALSHARV